MARKSLCRSLAVLAFAVAVRTSGEVLDVGANGFAVRDTVTVPGDPARAYAAVVAVGKWWDPEHTYSGDAANLSIDPRPQGCWCEKLPGQGGVRHLTVVYADPGKTLRFEGGLGPLQAMGVAGSLTFAFRPAEKGTAVELSYVIGGYNAKGFQEIAAGVDAVLRAQLERYRRSVETGKP